MILMHCGANIHGLISAFSQIAGIVWRCRGRCRQLFLLAIAILFPVRDYKRKKRSSNARLVHFYSTAAIDIILSADQLTQLRS